jgi:hypothetical protein
MISTTPNIHIQPMFQPSIPYPCTEPPLELVFENTGHSQTQFFWSSFMPLSFFVVVPLFLCMSI